nr:hypothetical protein [Lachnospiraceae bacterium]
LFMDVSQATVSNWCKGLKMPRMDKIDKICLFFNINRSDLMEDRTDLKEIQKHFSDHNIDNSDYRLIFSKNLKKYMELNQKEQIDLINDLGFNKSAVSTWCNGTRLPRMDKVNILAEYFGIKRSDLIEDKSNDPIKKEQFTVHSTKKDLTCIISEELGEQTEKALNLFLKLDEIDREKIIERMDTYLEAEKYSNQKGYKHA